MRRLFSAFFPPRLLWTEASVNERTGCDVYSKQVDCTPRRSYIRTGLTTRPKHESALRRITTQPSVIKSVACLAY